MQHRIPYMAGITGEDMMPPILHSMARKWNAAQETGNPNSDGLPKWSTAKETPNLAMNFGKRPTGMRKPSGLKMLLTMLTHKAVGE